MNMGARNRMLNEDLYQEEQANRQLAKELADLRAENLRMQTLLQELSDDPHFRVYMHEKRIAQVQAALSVKHHRRGECDCELCEPPRRDV
jgi:ribosomal protein L29